MRNKTLYTTPRYHLETFNCPHCGAYSKMRWHQLYIALSMGKQTFNNLNTTICDHCNNFSIWKEKEIIYPDITHVEKPNTDLPKEIARDYIEASNILNKSPRGSCALLRLAIAKLCIFLGEKGENLNLETRLFILD